MRREARNTKPKKKKIFTRELRERTENGMGNDWKSWPYYSGKLERIRIHIHKYSEVTMKRKTSRFYALCQTKRINYLMLLQYHQQSELYPEYLYNLMICNLFFFTGFRIHTNTQIHIKNWIRVSSGFYLSFFSRHGANAWCAICRP